MCLQKLIDIEFYYRHIPNIINILVLLLVLHICIFKYDCCSGGDGGVVEMIMM